MYLFFIGTDRVIDNPVIDPFFATFLGSFFVCFAYLQFMAALNIKLYSFIVGCLIFGRLFYIILLYSCILFITDFPSTFWFTGIIDSLFIVLYIIFAYHGDLTLRDLFLPKIEIKTF
jgi:hypothetical protein